MADKRPKRPRDLNQWAKHLVGLTTQDGSAHPPTPDTKDPAAAESGRRGGLKGGKARAQKLSAKDRVAIARKAAKARWNP